MDRSPDDACGRAYDLGHSDILLLAGLSNALVSTEVPARSGTRPWRRPINADNARQPGGNATVSRTQRLLSRAARFAIAAAIFAAAGYILYRELSQLDIGAFTAAMRDTAPWRIVCSLLLTALSFAAIALYDFFAARLVAPQRISARRALFAGATGNAIANTLGFHAITGSAVRYRIFASVGVTAADVAKIISLQGASLAAGFVSVTAFSLLLSPTNHGGVGRYAGMAMLAALGGILAWLYTKKRTISIGRWTLPFPNVVSAAQQLAIGTVEMSAAIGALYVLLPTALAPIFSMWCCFIWAPCCWALSAERPAAPAYSRQRCS